MRKRWHLQELLNESGGSIGGGATLLAAAKQTLVEWIDPTIASTITNSPVARIIFPINDGFLARKNFQRSTTVSPADRPAISGGRLTFDGNNDCLDGSAGYNYIGATIPADTFYCEATKGPTTTGLMRVVSDNTWWLGGFGKKNVTTQAGETFDGGPVHYSNDFRTIIQEIRFNNLGLPGVGMQGITPDYTNGFPNGSIWVADPITGKIFLIDPTGPTVTRTLTFAGANGLAYDTINNELWVSVANSITFTRINKTTGATTATFTHRDLTDAANDMLFFDGAYGTAGALYQTCRDNNCNGRIIKYDLSSFTPIKAWSILEIQAMEGGLHVTGTTFETCDDEYYHNTIAAVNRVVATTVDTNSPDYGTRIILAGECKIAATPGATVALCHGGDSIARKGIGLFFTTTPNQFRLIFRGSGVQATVDWLIGSTTTEFVYYLDINSATGDCSLYINGVLISTQNNAAVAGSMPSLVWTLGASYEGATAVATRFAAVTIGGWMVGTSPNFQSQLEGYLSWQTQGSGALLQVGHLYKNAAPV